MSPCGSPTLELDALNQPPGCEVCLTWSPVRILCSLLGMCVQDHALLQDALFCTYSFAKHDRQGAAQVGVRPVRALSLLL